MYFMLSVQLVCVLIIIATIGLINASQELRSPLPALFLCKGCFLETILLKAAEASVPTVLGKKETLSSANIGHHLGGCAIV